MHESETYYHFFSRENNEYVTHYVLTKLKVFFSPLGYGSKTWQSCALHTKVLADDNEARLH